MKLKTTISVIFIVIGVALIGFSIVVKSKVAQGQATIEHAQKSIDTGNTLFSLTPATKDLSKGMTGGAQKKIDAGKEQVAFYAGIANLAQIGGIILVAVGAGALLIRSKKKR